MTVLAPADPQDHARDPEPPTRFRFPAGRSGGISMAVLCLIVGLLVISPLVEVVVRSFTTTGKLGQVGEPTLDNYRGLATQAGLAEMIANTVLLSVGATAFALAIGGGLAWLVERTNARGGLFCQVVMLLSLSIPYVLYSIAWIVILSPTGPVNGALQRLFGLATAPVNPYTMTTMIVVEGLIATPLAFLFLSPVLRSIDASLEEGAAIAGGRPWRVLRTITIPLIRPAILAVFLLIFIRIMESFEVPALIGLPGNIQVITTAIFLDTRGFPPMYGRAGAYAVLLMLAVSVLLYLSARLTRQADAFATVTGKATWPRRTDLRGKRWLGTLAVIAYAVVALVVPASMILWTSLMPYFTSPSLTAINLLTLDNYRSVLADPAFGSSVWNTFVVGLVSATAIMAIAAWGIWLSARRKVRGGQLLEQLSATPLVIPGIIMGFAIASLYLSIPTPFPVYGTLLILMIGYVTRYLPFGMRYASAGMIQIHRSLEEAASTSGARPGRSLRKVVLPLAAPSLVAGWLFIFLVSTKELSMAVLLASPGSEVLSVSLYNQWLNGQTTRAAAIGNLWTLALTVLMTLFVVMTRRRGVKVDA